MIKRYMSSEGWYDEAEDCLDAKLDQMRNVKTKVAIEVLTRLR